MNCPNCGFADVKLRLVPIEIYANDNTPLYRLPDALMLSCLKCGSEFYDEEALHTTRQEKFSIPALALAYINR